MRRCPFVLLLLISGGCPQTGDSTTSTSGNTTYDGQWQLRATTGQPPACLTIQGGRVVEFNQGCSGTLRAVVDLLGVQGSGNSVRWTFSLLVDGVLETVTLAGTVQSDGSITGSVDGTIGGQPVSSSFTMTKQQ